MKHCGNEKCQAKACPNWEKCRGETIPPWICVDPSKSTAAVSVREQDVLAAADVLAAKVLAEQAEECLSCVTTKERPMDCMECRWNTIGLLASAYQRVREGKR